MIFITHFSFYVSDVFLLILWLETTKTHQKFSLRFWDSYTANTCVTTGENGSVSWFNLLFLTILASFAIMWYALAIIHKKQFFPFFHLILLADHYSFSKVFGFSKKFIAGKKQNKWSEMSYEVKKELFIIEVIRRGASTPAPPFVTSAQW